MGMLLAPLLALVVAVALAILFKANIKIGISEEQTYQRLQISVSDPAAAVQHMAKILSFETVSDHEAPNKVLKIEPFNELGAYLHEAYPRVHSELELQLVNEHSRLYTWVGEDTSLRPLLLMSHQDVVPAPTEGTYNWTYPPFAGTVAEGYIWGRGALDTKVTLVATLEAVEELLQQGFKPRRTVLLAFGHDEEVGGQKGAYAIAELLASRGVAPELVMDEGGLVLADGLSAAGVALVDEPLALVGTAEKGYSSWELRLRGTGGHSSMPPQGSGSVAARLARVLAAIEASPPPLRLGAPVTHWLRQLGGAAKYKLLKVVLENVDNKVLRPLLARVLVQGGADLAAMLRTTCAVVSVQAGGIAANVLPNSATIKLNFRTLPGDDGSFIRRYLETVTHKEKGHVEIMPSEDQPPVKASSVTPSDGPHFQLIRQAIQETLAPPKGMVVAPYLLTGMTDSRHYDSIFPIATGRVFRFSPQFYNRTAGDVGRLHGVDERVGVSDYLRGIGFYMRFIQLATQDESYEDAAPMSGSVV